MKNLIVLLFAVLLVSVCKSPNENKKINISKIEFHLIAFGVESDDFPSIDGHIDFANDSSHFTKSYYNPAHESSSYHLSPEEIKKVSDLLHCSNLPDLKPTYSVTKTDQPTSTLLIYTDRQTYRIEDYGLEGDHPLPELYKIVYRFSVN